MHAMCQLAIAGMENNSGQGLRILLRQFWYHNLQNMNMRLDHAVDTLFLSEFHLYNSMFVLRPTYNCEF